MNMIEKADLTKGSVLFAASYNRALSRMYGRTTLPLPLPLPPPPLPNVLIRMWRW